MKQVNSWKPFQFQLAMMVGIAFFFFRADNVTDHYQIMCNGGMGGVFMGMWFYDSLRWLEIIK